MKVKSKKYLLRIKDVEFKLKIKKRDDNKCQMCLKNISGINAQVSHLIPKTFEEYRWEEMNCVLLCYYCHEAGKYSCHKNPIYFTEWLKNNKNLHYDWVIEKLKLI